jgi:hypothetical protein
MNGVSTHDPLEAAVACERCRNAHVVALLGLEPKDFEPPPPYTGEDEGD